MLRKVFSLEVQFHSDEIQDDNFNFFDNECFCGAEGVQFKPNVSLVSF